MATDATISRDSPLAKSPRRLRITAAVLVAISCIVLAFVPYSSQGFDGPPSHLSSDRYDFGWPLPCFRVIRIEDSPSAVDLWLTKTQVAASSLTYDVVAIVTLIVSAYFFFVPWSGFPEPRFSLADVFIIVSCGTVGIVVWHQLCYRRFVVERDSQVRFFIDSIAYLIITLAAAGTLKGLIAITSAWMRRRTADGQ